MLRATTFSRAAVLAVLALTLSASFAAAALRSPQVPFNYAPLQTVMNGIDGGINVATDQQDAQLLSSGYTGNADVTLFIKNAPANYGIYSALTPTQLPLFGPPAIDGYRALLHFDNSNGVVVNFQDDSANPIGSTSFSPIDRNDFGFFSAGPNGTFFQQDGKNPGSLPQVLAFAGTGANYGETFLCFELDHYNPGVDFNDALIVVQSVVPTPTKQSTWGKIKTLYR
jgi:hypothetical protein